MSEGGREGGREGKGADKEDEEEEDAFGDTAAPHNVMMAILIIMIIKIDLFWCGVGVGICEGRCEAPLPFRAKLGAPLREDIVHLATVFARAAGPRWRGEGGVRI